VLSLEFFLNKNKDNNFNDGQILENEILKTKLKDEIKDKLF
jgi:hypothetical protein